MDIHARDRPRKGGRLDGLAPERDPGRRELPPDPSGELSGRLGARGLGDGDEHAHRPAVPHESSGRLGRRRRAHVDRPVPPFPQGERREEEGHGVLLPFRDADHDLRAGYRRRPDPVGEPDQQVGEEGGGVMLGAHGDAALRPPASDLVHRPHQDRIEEGLESEIADGGSAHRLHPGGLARQERGQKIGLMPGSRIVHPRPLDRLLPRERAQDRRSPIEGGQVLRARPVEAAEVPEDALPGASAARLPDALDQVRVRPAANPFHAEEGHGLPTPPARRGRAGPVGGRDGPPFAVRSV